MKKQTCITAWFTVFLLLSMVGNIHAQQHHSKSNTKFNTDGSAETLIKVFKDSIYQFFYKSDYWQHTTAPVFTVIKIDFDKIGKLTKLQFSDSADSLFADAFFKKTNLNSSREILEKYAKAKSYQDISVLIPISYRSNGSADRGIDYNHAESLWVFGKENFSGKSILLSPIDITLISNKQ